MSAPDAKPLDPTASDDASGPAPARSRVSTRAFTIGALAIITMIACVVSVWASGHPDGLEFVAEQTGFLGAARDSATAGSPFADYALSLVENPWLSLALAGAVGCAVTFGLAWLIGRVSGRTSSDG